MAKRTTAKTATKAKTKTDAPRPSASATPPEAGISAPRADKDADISSDTNAASGEQVKILGKRELVERVVSASGIKKRAAKPVIEAMLKELGDALSRGETLNLQPFGKGIVKTRKDLENAEVVELRLRRSKLALKAAETPASDPLAEAAE